MNNSKKKRKWLQVILALSLMMNGILIFGVCLVRPIAVFNRTISPGMEESDVLKTFGQPSHLLSPGQEAVVENDGFNPQLVLPIENKVLVYYHGVSRFAVYIGSNSKVQCVLTSGT